MAETTKSKQNGAANAAQQGKINHAVIEFIRNCTAFEADAFRIMVCIADGKLQIDSLTPSESALLNNYLNDGCFKEDTDVRKLEKHRRERARQLMTKVETYVKGSNMADAHYALYDFASNETFATEGVKTLPSKVQEKPMGGQSLLDFNK